MLVARQVLSGLARAGQMKRNTGLFSPVTSSFVVQTSRRFHGSTPAGDREKISLVWTDAEGKEMESTAYVGDSLLTVARQNDIDLEGACEASLACSTCHVILSKELFNSLPEPTDEENDMLDLAFGLTSTSRLGCQVKVCKEMDGAKIRLPSATRNMAVDGYKPKPH